MVSKYVSDIRLQPRSLKSVSISRLVSLVTSDGKVVKSRVSICNFSKENVPEPDE